MNVAAHRTMFSAPKHNAIATEMLRIRLHGFRLQKSIHFAIIVHARVLDRQHGTEARIQADVLRHG